MVPQYSATSVTNSSGPHNVTSAPITSGGNAPSVTGEKPEPNLQPEPKVPGKTSPAFAVARALNPVKEEEDVEAGTDIGDDAIV